MKDAEALLEIDGLDVRFPTEDGVVHAVRDVSLQIGRGELLGVVGESGSGKSVTALAIMGLLPPSARVTGVIGYDGEKDLLRLHPRERAAYRGRRIGMVFQDPMSALNPVKSVGWQLDEAVRAHQHVSRREARRRSIDLLDRVGIPNAGNRVNAYPHQFSGGMRQRVVIAMAIANSPQLLIADEPTTALDVTVQAAILELIAELAGDSGASVMLITHDLGVVARMASRVVVMYAGAIVESGPVEAIFHQPLMPYTGGLMGAIPRVATDGGRLNQITGSTPSLIRRRPGCPFAPRCPLAVDICHRVEPALERVGDDDRMAACHRWRELVGVDVPALFRRSDEAVLT